MVQHDPLTNPSGLTVACAIIRAANERHSLEPIDEDEEDES